VENSLNCLWKNCGEKNALEVAKIYGKVGFESATNPLRNLEIFARIRGRVAGRIW